MFKKVKKDATLPTRGSKYSACVDVYANEDVTIGAGETKLVGLGITIDDKEIKRIVSHHYYYLDKNADKDFEYVKKEFLKSHYLQLMLRSSLATKGLMLGNGVGVIDLDYKDEIKMIIHNPIMYIDKELNFDKEEDFIDLCYMGASNKGGVYVYSNTFKIKKGDRIGQLALLEHKSSLFGIESEDERNGGFGSTDKKENNV